MHENTDADINLASRARMNIENAVTLHGDEDLNGIIEFQFPPVIKSDRKSANWKTIDQYSYEPAAYWAGSTARAISLQWEYVVTSSDPQKWSAEKIMRNMRNIKAYFYISVSDDQAEVYPIVSLVLYDYLPENNGNVSTWRMMSVSITPSGPLISEGENAIQLKHTITAELELLSQNNPIFASAASADDSSAKLQSKKLPSGFEIKKWF